MSYECGRFRFLTLVDLCNMIFQIIRSMKEYECSLVVNDSGFQFHPSVFFIVLPSGVMEYVTCTSNLNLDADI